MISDKIPPEPRDDGESAINLDNMQMLCFRLSMILNTSMEYLAKLPYKDLLKFADEIIARNER